MQKALFEQVERGKDGWQDAVIRVLRGGAAGAPANPGAGPAEAADTVAGPSTAYKAAPSLSSSTNTKTRATLALEALQWLSPTYENTLLMTFACKKGAGPVLKTVLEACRGDGEMAGGEKDENGNNGLALVANRANTFGETALHRVAQATQLDGSTKAEYAMLLLMMGADRKAATLYVSRD